MEKIKDFVNKNYKIVIGIILGITISIGIGVSAVATKDIVYDNSTSGLTSTNLQGAIDELNDKAKTHCPDGYKCTKIFCTITSGDLETIGSEAVCADETFYITGTGDTINMVGKYAIDSSYVQSTSPTAVSYSTAQTYLSNYISNIDESLKPYIITSGFPSYEEIIKLGVSNSYGGYNDPENKLSIGIGSSAYWLDSTSVFGFVPGPSYQKINITDNTSTTYTYIGPNVTYSLYARPWLEVSSAAFNS